MTAVSSISLVRCLSNSSQPCLMISLSSSSTASCRTPQGGWGSSSGHLPVQGFWLQELLMLTS